MTAIAGREDAVKVVVCGPGDGIAGLVASTLAGAGGMRQVLLAKETETLEDQVGRGGTRGGVGGLLPCHAKNKL